MLKLTETTSPHKLFPSDYITLYKIWYRKLTSTLFGNFELEAWQDLTKAQTFFRSMPTLVRKVKIKNSQIYQQW